MRRTVRGPMLRASMIGFRETADSTVRTGMLARLPVTSGAPMPFIRPLLIAALALPCAWAAAPATPAASAAVTTQHHATARKHHRGAPAAKTHAHHHAAKRHHHHAHHHARAHGNSHKA